MLESTGKTVLVVDDEEGIRNFLTRLLTSLNFHVICAADTEAAMEQLDKADIVISDIRIGDENGIEFLQYLREQGVDKPFLLMSGDPSPNENEMAIELTGHPVLFKPNIVRELPSIINKISLPC